MRRIYILLIVLATVTSLYGNLLEDVPIDGIKYYLWDSEAQASGLENESFSGELVIPDNIEYQGTTYAVTGIRPNAFADCKGITKVTIGEKIETIFGWAFADCTMLSSFNIPNSVIRVGSNPFDNTVWYNSQPQGPVYKDNVLLRYKGQSKSVVEIANGTRIIADNAFINCFDLQSIQIPNSVIAIGERAFAGCDLSEIRSLIEVPFSLEDNNVFGFDNDDNPEELYDGITLYVPAGTKAKYEATDGWKEFKNIVEMEPESPYEVKEDWTAIVKNLKPDEEGKLVIPEKVEIDGKECPVTEIAPEALRGNQDLVEVTIPGTVITIGASAFAGCGNLKAIYLMSATPIALSQAAARGMIRRAERTTVSQFDGVDYETCVLYVPYGSGEAYRNAEGWNLFKHIVEMEDTGINGATINDDITNGKCYDLKGRRINQPWKGVNILRDSYGRTRKVMKK